MNMTIKYRYDHHYDDWKKLMQSSSMIHSDDQYYTNNVHFQAIIDLGEAAIPLMIETLKDHDEYSHFMINALQKVTNHQFNQQEIAAAELLFGRPLSNQVFVYLWIGWWRKKRQT